MSQIRHYVSVVSAPLPPSSVWLPSVKKQLPQLGLPDWRLGRSGWSGATGQNFLELAPTIHAFMLPKAKLLVLRLILCCTLPRVPFDTKQKQFNELHKQFVCAAVGQHPYTICDWLTLPIDYILMILGWLIRSAVSHSCLQAGNRSLSHKLTMHGLGAAVPRCLI